jgi:hypothetical protein
MKLFCNDWMPQLRLHLGLLALMVGECVRTSLSFLNFPKFPSIFGIVILEVPTMALASLSDYVY